MRTLHRVLRRAHTIHVEAVVDDEVERLQGDTALNYRIERRRPRAGPPLRPRKRRPPGQHIRGRNDVDQLRTSMYLNNAEMPLMWGRKLKLKAKLENSYIIRFQHNNASYV